MSRGERNDPATGRLLACIEDEELAARYPGRTHFIAADHAHQGEMAAHALREGDPVVLLYPDGYELLISPEDGSTSDPRLKVHVETRDADGRPIPMSGVIDAIPDAWERTQEGLAQAMSGEGTLLDDLL